MNEYWDGALVGLALLILILQLLWLPVLVLLTSIVSLLREQHDHMVGLATRMGNIETTGGLLRVEVLAALEVLAVLDDRRSRRVPESQVCGTSILPDISEPSSHAWSPSNYSGAAGYPTIPEDAPQGEEKGRKP